MRIRDWSSDVCSSDPATAGRRFRRRDSLTCSATSVRCGKQPGTASGTSPDPQVLLWERQWPRCSSRKAIAAMAAPTGLLSGGSPREANVGWVERSDTHRPRSDLPMGIAFASHHPAAFSREMTYQTRKSLGKGKSGEE